MSEMEGLVPNNRTVRSNTGLLAPSGSVRHQRVFCDRNNRLGRADFWHGGFLRFVLGCVVRKFGYLQKSENFSRELSAETLDLEKISSRHVERRNVLSTTLVAGRALLITLATVATPWFNIGVILHSPRQWRNYNFCPPPGKHSLRARVHLWNFGIINSDQSGTVK